MRVLIATPECFPFVTTGGLGEMVSGFVKTLARRGHEVHVGLPLYGSVCPSGDWTKTDNIAVPFGGGIRLCSVWTHCSEGVTYHFIEYHAYFGGSNVYGGENEGERFAFFCRALLAVCETFHWVPDVIHAHDWTMALLPVESSAAQTAFAIPLSVFITTIFCAKSIDVTDEAKSWSKLERKSDDPARASV